MNKVIALLLQWDGDEEILSVPGLVKWVYALFYFVVIGFLVRVSVYMFYPRGSDYEASYSFVARFIDFIFVGCILWMFIILIFNNYKYLMQKGKSLKFGNILLYYAFGTFLFGKAYASLYILNQKLFHYINPPIQITEVVQGGLNAFKLESSFIIYAFLTSFSADYYKISTNHSIISLLNILQLLFTFFIFTIIVSLFIQKNKYYTNR